MPSHKTPKPPKPWDRRPPSERGSETADEIYRAVGMTLTSWERVESGLAHIFALIIYPSLSSDTPALRAYGSVSNFASRMEMIEAAAEAFFDPTFKRRPLRNLTASKRTQAFMQELERDLRTICDELRQWAARRNDIAHAIVSGDATRGFLLKPAFYNAAKNPLKPRVTLFYRGVFRYSADEVLYFENEFGQLLERLFKIRDSLFQVHSIDSQRQREWDEYEAKMSGRRA